MKSAMFHLFVRIFKPPILTRYAKHSHQKPRAILAVQTMNKDGAFALVFQNRQEKRNRIFAGQKPIIERNVDESQPGGLDVSALRLD